MGPGNNKVKQIFYAPQCEFYMHTSETF